MELIMDQDQSSVLQSHILPQLLYQFTPKGNGVWVASKHDLNFWLRQFGWNIDDLLKTLRSFEKSNVKHYQTVDSLLIELFRLIDTNHITKEIQAHVGRVSSLSMSEEVKRDWRLFIDRNKRSYDIVREL